MTEDVVREGELITAESGNIALLSKAEIDQQIATARKFPRSLKRFISEATDMVTLNESIAQQCIYALPRDGKVIEGASARFAEIIASAWGNCRAGSRVISDAGDFVTSQGVFHDLERNVAISYEVQRRITDKSGRRFKPDMIGVTANAACSIALRNAILKGVPKAFWESLYQKARAVIAGDVKTLVNKRADAIKQFAIFGVSEAQIVAKLGREGIADVGVDDLVTLFGMLTAIRDGDSTPEQMFPPAEETQQRAESADPTAAKREATATRKMFPEDQFKAGLPSWQAMIRGGKKSVAEMVTMLKSKGDLTPEQHQRLLEAVPASNGGMSPEEIAEAEAREKREAAGLDG